MYRVFVSLTAALPATVSGNEEAGEDADGPVYNFRGSVGTGHFLGQLFRTLGQVLNLPQQQPPQVLPPQPQVPISNPPQPRAGVPSGASGSGQQASSRKKRKDKTKSKEVSTQTEESPPSGASVKAATTSAGQYDAISGDDVTGKEGHSVVYKSTGAVPKTTKVKGAQPPPPQPSFSLVSKRPFLPPTTSTSSVAGSLNPEVKAPAEGQSHHRPLFVCNTGYPHYHPKGGLTTSASVKTKWKRRPKTQWEETAKTMLDMTVMYLRKLPQSAVQSDSQVQVISKLGDHTLEGEVLSHLLAQLQIVDEDNDEGLSGGTEESEEELSKATIRWACSMALHLLALSRLNNTATATNKIKKKQITALPKKISSS